MKPSSTRPESQRPTSRLRAALRANRRPVLLVAASLTCLAVHHALLREMAHGHVAHVLLGAGSAEPPAGAATLAIGLIASRLVTVMLVPGLLLAATAEVLAYVLVGPQGAAADEDEEA